MQQFGLSCSPGADNEESMLSLYPEGSWLEAEIGETNFRRIVVRSFRVNPPAKPKHPLWFVAIAFLLTLPFDFYSYIGQSFLTAFGLVVIAAKLVFLFLTFDTRVSLGMSEWQLQQRSRRSRCYSPASEARRESVRTLILCSSWVWLSCYSFTSGIFESGIATMLQTGSNQSMKPTAPLQCVFRVFATTPSTSSRFPASLVRFASSRSPTPAVLLFNDSHGLSPSR